MVATDVDSSHQQFQKTETTLWEKRIFLNNCGIFNEMLHNYIPTKYFDFSRIRQQITIMIINNYYNRLVGFVLFISILL